MTNPKAKAIGQHLIEALNLPPYTTRLEIVVTPDEATVKAEFIPDLNRIERITKTFDIVPRA